MKNILDRFVVGVSRLLQRQGGFYLAFFIFNCLPMCCYMVMKKMVRLCAALLALCC